MELWIRSQDKNVLENVKGFCITHSDENRWNILNVDTTTRYGTYKSKERALEILDEIQKLLQPQMVLSKAERPIAETCDGTVYVSPAEYEIKELSYVIYEMPEE